MTGAKFSEVAKKIVTIEIDLLSTSLNNSNSACNKKYPFFSFADIDIIARMYILDGPFCKPGGNFTKLCAPSKKLPAHSVSKKLPISFTNILPQTLPIPV